MAVASHISYCLILILVVGHGINTLAAIVQETLVFSAGEVSPDGFPQPGILINGSSPPGPTITLNKGDSLRLLVINELPDTFALHMHGLFQFGTQRSDGVPFITQDPIQPNSSYLYITHAANQTGTFMYHAHTGLDLAFAYGGLIIKDGEEVAHNPIYYYDEEILLICNQYWHVTIGSIQEGLEGSPFEDVPDTASLLINGRSYGVWDNSTSATNNYTSSLVSNNTQNEGPEGYTVIRVTQGKKYRFRVIGLGVDSMIRMRIDNHTELSVIEIDGVLTDPVITDHLDLNAAQRSSIIVEMNQPIGNYWIVSELYPGPGPRNGRAILHYEGAPDPTPMMTTEFPGETEEIELDTWILDDLHPSTSLNDERYAVPKQVDREIVIRSFQTNLPDGRTKFDVNGVLIRPHDIGPTLINLPESELLANATYYGVYEILLGERVQIIFENTMSDDGECEQHPWHLHGHDFHVVANGPDAYDAEDRILIDQIVANRSDFIVRDVVTLFPDQVVENTTSKAPCGWTAIRFVADNPGIWLTHCHLTPHQIMGKHFVLYEH